ncbi:unannotated protein [freshwater metagenome]|uniref:Unannotated protein n=1 Tax=freshwater metagenome TaxID=449393 RepID=A0A6J7IBI5_9ZZZZ
MHLLHGLISVVNIGEYECFAISVTFGLDLCQILREICFKFAFERGRFHEYRRIGIGVDYVGEVKINLDLFVVKFNAVCA